MVMKTRQGKKDDLELQGTANSGIWKEGTEPYRSERRERTKKKSLKEIQRDEEEEVAQF